MGPYTISISNKSGRQQSYAIFAEAPSIKSCSPTTIQVTTSIISSVHGVASGNGKASFVLSKNIFATCGTYDVELYDQPSDGKRGPIGTGTEVVDQRQVMLSKKDSHGVLIAGSLLEIDVSDDCPVFATKEPEAKADMDCFALKTQNDFTMSEAKTNKYILGFSSSVKQSIGPHATWVPAPGQTYNIKPAKIFYIIVGSFNSRDLIKRDYLNCNQNVCKVDFGTLGTDSVQLVHDERNTIQIAVLSDNQ